MAAWCGAATGSKISFHHNLWANHMARMPRPGNYDGPDKDPVGAFFDFRSNVFYNWGHGYSGYDADKAALVAYNFVDNAYVPGPNSEKNIAFKESNTLAKAYFAGNSMAGVIPADPWSLVEGVQEAGYRQTAPIDVAPVTPEPADKAYARILADAGASVWRDPVDKRILDGVKTRTGKVIDNQDDVGGWPALPAGKAAKDTDGDGMPDAWEKAHGLNPKKADGAAVAKGGSGGRTWSSTWRTRRRCERIEPLLRDFAILPRDGDFALIQSEVVREIDSRSIVSRGELS
jgi:hypothetical protein